MKKLVTLFTACLFSLFCVAQNLVPNPSFEEYDTCPTSTVTSRIELAKSWYTSRNTPDYFNACVNESFALWDIPNNNFGSQYASSGNAYSGLCTYGNPDGASENYREIIGIELLQALIQGEKYFVSFKVARATDGFNSHVNWATNKIGALFTTTKYTTVNSDSLPNFAQIYTDSIISDTLIWTKISNAFIADSAYQFLAIGNFFDATHTNSISYGPPSLGAYYYIDDVCVSTDSSGCPNFTHNNIAVKDNGVMVFPNPASNYLNVVNNHSFKHLNIVHLFGTEILSSAIDPYVHTVTLDVSDFPVGIYSVILTDYSQQKHHTTILINH